MYLHVYEEFARDQADSWLASRQMQPGSLVEDRRNSRAFVPRLVSPAVTTALQIIALIVTVAVLGWLLA